MRPLKQRLGLFIYRIWERLRAHSPVPPNPQHVREIVEGTPGFPARFYPVHDERTVWLQTPLPKMDAPDEYGLPIPPPKYRIYDQTREEYLYSGKIHVERMLNILREHEVPLREGQRVLDFGCSTGRMIRHLHPFSNTCEIWGSDITAQDILWCQTHLSPPFHFVTNTTYPHLPFEDHTFHLIYAGSIFTHIPNLADTWLLELRRVLHPGGVLYATVHDEHTIDILLDNSAQDSAMRSKLLGFRDEHYDFTQMAYDTFSWKYGRGQPQVFHRLGFLKDQWGAFFDILGTVEEAYGYQTAVVLRKNN